MFVVKINVMCRRDLVTYAKITVFILRATLTFISPPSGPFSFPFSTVTENRLASSFCVHPVSAVHCISTAASTQTETYAALSDMRHNATTVLSDTHCLGVCACKIYICKRWNADYFSFCEKGRKGTRERREIVYSVNNDYDTQGCFIMKDRFLNYTPGADNSTSICVFSRNLSEVRNVFHLH